VLLGIAYFWLEQYDFDGMKSSGFSMPGLSKYSPGMVNRDCSDSLALMANLTFKKV
jgi:hypothetical protein